MCACLRSNSRSTRIARALQLNEWTRREICFPGIPTSSPSTQSMWTTCSTSTKCLRPANIFLLDRAKPVLWSLRQMTVRRLSKCTTSYANQITIARGPWAGTNRRTRLRQACMRPHVIYHSKIWIRRACTSRRYPRTPARPYQGLKWSSHSLTLRSLNANRGWARRSSMSLASTRKNWIRLHTRTIG